MTTIENLAGIPSANELSILANELFPDLVTNGNSSNETQPVNNIPQVDNVNYAAGEFDWEHPFAYGGSCQFCSSIQEGRGLGSTAGEDYRGDRYPDEVHSPKRCCTFSQAASSDGS